MAFFADQVICLRPPPPPPPRPHPHPHKPSPKQSSGVCPGGGSARQAAAASASSQVRGGQGVMGHAGEGKAGRSEGAEVVMPGSRCRDTEGDEDG